MNVVVIALILFLFMISNDRPRRGEVDTVSQPVPVKKHQEDEGFGITWIIILLIVAVIVVMGVVFYVIRRKTPEDTFNPLLYHPYTPVFHESQMRQGLRKYRQPKSRWSRFFPK